MEQSRLNFLKLIKKNFKRDFIKTQIKINPSFNLKTYNLRYYVINNSKKTYFIRWDVNTIKKTGSIDHKNVFKYQNFSNFFKKHYIYKF